MDDETRSSTATKATMTDTAAVAAAAAMTDTDDDDEPRLSSAALCIELELVNHSEQKFHPEFTHQVFDGGVEYIRGYQPKSSSSVLATAMPNTIQHKSHLRHETATHEITIHVTLAPSCRMCSLKIEAAAKKQHPHSDEQQPQQHCSRPSSRREKEAKRRKRNNDDNNNNNNNNSNEQAEGRANVLTPEMEDEEEEKPKEEQQQDSNKDEESEHEPMANTSGNSNSNGSCSGEEEEDNEDTVHAQKEEEGSCRTPLAEVQKQLSRALPDIVNDDDIKVENDYLTEPFGRILQEYTRRRNSNSMTGGGEHQQQEFCITLAQGQDAHVGRYHHSVQRLARFFIETADDVDVSSTDDGGYWRILYLFCRHRHHDGDLAKSKYSLAGYVTLFHFASPFRKPRPGTIVRICQAMILPPFQRAGHGRQMLLTIYRWVLGEYAAASTATTTTLPSSLEAAAAAAITAADHSDIVEINVESPAPAFVALRNRVDFEEFLRANEKGEPWIVSLDHAQGNKTTSTDGGGGIDATVAENVHDKTFFQPLTEARAKSAATRAKITPRQIHIVYELDRLYSFQLTKQQQSKQNSDSSDNHHHHHHDNVDENLEKQYRLMVKRRLKREHKEDLSACKGKTEMQTLLAKLYDDERSMYDVILASMLK